MICVFDVIEGPARGKRFWMRQDQRMEIGRISTADISIPADHHMSRHHMIVEATVESFRVRDVGSANGTFVNNAKISALDLCSGDKIRAGTSTFKVSLISDDTSPHAADGLSLDSSVALQRSVAGSSSAVNLSANLPGNQSAKISAVDEPQVSPPIRSVQMSNLVDLGSLPGDSEDTQKLYSVARILDSVAKVSGSAAVSASSSSNSSSAVLDACGTELQSATWVADYFAPTKVPQLFHQVKAFDDREFDLADLLQLLDGEYRLTAVLNTAHSGHFALEVIEDWRKLSRVMDLSPKLCLLTSDGSHEFWSMIRDSLRREALIVFGSFEPLKNEWLEHVADLLRSPTTLSELLSGSTEALRNELLDQAAFILFEQDRRGQLGLLARNR